MIQAIPILFLLYLVAVHTSIAGMELLSWFIGASVLTESVRSKVAWNFKEEKILLASLGALVVWVGITSSFSSLGFMRWVVLLVLLKQGLGLVWNRNFESKWLKTWTVILGICGAYATLQFFTGVDFIRPGRDLVDPQGGGIYKAVGFFSLSLTFAYMIGISTIAVSKVVWCQLPSPYWVAILLGGMGVMASMSRATWLGFLICVGIFLSFKARRLVVPFVLAAILGVGLATMLNEGVGNRVRSLIQMRSDHSSMMRVHLWQAYGSLYKEHPITGVGLHEGHKHLTEIYARDGIRETFVSHAHNVYLQWLAGTGIPGFALFLIICGWFLKTAWQIREKSKWGWGLLLAQVFWMIGALSENNFFDGEVNHFIVLLWAFTWQQKDLTDQKSNLAD